MNNPTARPKPTPIQEKLEQLLEGCDDNRDFYRGYLKFSSPRIEQDAINLSRCVPPETSILDIGAVPPLLASLLRDIGFSDICVMDPNARLFARFFRDHAIDYVEADLLQADWPGLGRQYGLVCLSEVIEHLGGNMLSALGRAIDLVEPGGYFFLTTPNLRSISGLVALLWYGSGLASKPRDGVRAQYERAGSEYGYYGHLREYTEREVVNLVSSFGLRHVASFYQARYHAERRMERLAMTLERFVPSYRMFGKYLFQKPGLT
jgi:SAM-dependent methyltransferase